MKLEDLMTILSEQATRRKDVEGDITSLSLPITKHLVKILKWEDNLNYKKHLVDIDTWLTDISILKLKGNKLPKQRDYFQWMFLDVSGKSTTVNRLIRTMRNYHQLKVIRTDEQVFEELQRIFLLISKDLSTDNLKTIENYL